MIAFAAAMRLQHAAAKQAPRGSGNFSVRPRWDLSSLEAVSR
jgi:hypothetical protein